MSSRVSLLLSLFILLFVVTTPSASAQTLPDKVRSLLDQKYSGWQAYTSPCQSQAFASGDFDGDGKTDYAVMFQQGKAGGTVAFLANGTDYKVIPFESAATGTHGKDLVLTVAPKGHTYIGVVAVFSGPKQELSFEQVPGQKLILDTPRIRFCEGRVTFFYVFGDDEFKQVSALTPE